MSSECSLLLHLLLLDIPPYPLHRFNWAARKLNRRLEQLGATNFVDGFEADEQFPDGYVRAYANASCHARLIMMPVALTEVSYAGQMGCISTSSNGILHQMALAPYLTRSFYLLGGPWNQLYGGLCPPHGRPSTATTASPLQGYLPTGFWPYQKDGLQL